jgi:hypothetical protein
MAANKVLSPSSLAHIVLRTETGDRFRAMRDFYINFLGAYAEIENDTLSYLRYDEEHHRIAIMGLPGIRRKDRLTPGLGVLLSAFKA